MVGPPGLELLRRRIVMTIKVKRNNETVSAFFKFSAHDIIPKRPANHPLNPATTETVSVPPGSLKRCWHTCVGASSGWYLPARGGKTKSDHSSAKAPQCSIYRHGPVASTAIRRAPESVSVSRQFQQRTIAGLSVSYEKYRIITREWSRRERAHQHSDRVVAGLSSFKIYQAR